LPSTGRFPGGPPVPAIVAIMGADRDRDRGLVITALVASAYRATQPTSPVEASKIPVTMT
jgi:hypothetical protein